MLIDQGSKFMKNALELFNLLNQYTPEQLSRMEILNDSPHLPSGAYKAEDIFVNEEDEDGDKKLYLVIG